RNHHLPLEALGECVGLDGRLDGRAFARHPHAAARQLACDIGNDAAGRSGDEADQIVGRQLGARDDAAAERAPHVSIVCILQRLLLSAQSDVPLAPAITVYLSTAASLPPSAGSSALSSTAGCRSS